MYTFLKCVIPKSLIAVYFLTFLCHRLFEASFVKKTWERHTTFFTYSCLSYKVNFFKLAVEGNETAKGKQQSKKESSQVFPVPGRHLSLSLKLSCFYLESIEHHKNHLLVLRAKIPAVSVAIALGPLPDGTVEDTAQHTDSQNVLLSWGFVFSLCVCENVTDNWMCFLQIFRYGSKCFLLHQELINPIHLEANWSSTGCKSASATGQGIRSFCLSHSQNSETCGVFFPLRSP